MEFKNLYEFERSVLPLPREMSSLQVYNDDHSQGSGSVQSAPVWRGPPVDAEGRLLDPRKLWEAKQDNIPEDFDVFVDKWSPQQMSSKLNWKETSKVVWPNLPYQVTPQRLDVFECRTPYLQQATTSERDSNRIRRLKGWFPVRSIIVVDQPAEYTKEMLIEAAAPPRRSRFRPSTQKNHRDLTDWSLKETFMGYVTAANIPGAVEFCVDWADSPDRYQISSEEEPAMGWRRLFRFGAYPMTQYYILEKVVFHDVLEAEGGRGLTCKIEKGPILFARKGWKLKGSFYAFDHAINGSNKYTVYYIEDPFPRTMVAIGDISHVEAWEPIMTFYAFDVPAPCTCLYNLQHCVRSIHSTSASVPRHRLTIEDAANPFEFRMAIYVFPATLDQVTLTDEPPEEDFFDENEALGG